MKPVTRGRARVSGHMQALLMPSSIFFLFFQVHCKRRKMATATPQGLLIYHAVPTQSTAGLGLG